MRRCISSLSLVLQQYQHTSRTSGRRHRGKKRSKTSAAFSPLRDAVGMTIPESRLRRRGVSLDVFDRSIEERSRDILGLDEDATHQRRAYGAEFDRREVRFQGSSGDLCQFAEMAARAEATKKWNDTLQRQQDGVCEESLPPNAVAYVRQPLKELQKGDGASDETRKSAKGGSSALLQRALRHYHGEALSKDSSILEKETPLTTSATRNAGTASISTVNDSMGVNQMSESKRRAERRRRRLERILGSEGGLHPCVHQGGCAVHGGATQCPFVMYPSTICVTWLRHGHCDDAVGGCCPWWHGNLAGTAGTDVSASCLFHTAEDDPDLDGKQEQQLLMQENCTWMGTLLQMFLDLLTAAVGQDTQLKSGAAELSVVEVQQHLERVLRDRMLDVDLPVHFESSQGFLTVERELGVSGIMTAVELDNGEDESFDEMFTRELSSMQRSHLPQVKGEIDDVRNQQAQQQQQQQQQGEEHQLLYESGEQRLRRILSIFRGYITECSDHDGSGARIALCAPLTQWILRRAAQHHYDAHHTQKAVEVTPQKLFEEASTVLLQYRLEMFGISGDGNYTAESSHRWSTVLLLQQLTLLARIPTSYGSSQIMGATAQRSLLYKLLLLAHTRGNSLWPGDTIHKQYINCWVFLQSLLSAVSLRIIRQSISLFAYVRPAIIGVTRQLARDVEEEFAHLLLRASGWSTWTDAQMFAPRQMDTYTAAGYALHHLPVIRHSFVVSVLNVLLLHVGREASNTYQLHWSPLKAVLFSTGGDAQSHQETLERERRLRISSSISSSNSASKSGIRLRRGIRPYAQEALTILSALQEESKTVEARRQLLMEEFTTRRMEYRERTESSDMSRRRNKQVTSSTKKSNRSHAWTSKKNRRKSNNTCKNKSNYTCNNDEVNVVETNDHLPPHGSVMVAADAVGLLLRLLLEGGWAYRSLRLAATAIYTASRHHKKNEKGENGETKENKRGAGGLWLQLNVAAVAAVAAVVMRLPTGGRLVQTVIAGRALRDSTACRCLPAPNLADVHPQSGTIAAAAGVRVLRTILALLSDDNEKRGGNSNAGGSDRSDSHIQPIGVTARVLEVVVTQTPGSNREAHSTYERIIGMDPRTRVNDGVFLAQQYHKCRHYFAGASGVAAAVWLDFVQSSMSSMSSSTAIALHKELGQLPTPVGFEEQEVTSPYRWKHKYRQQIPQSPRTIEELKTHLHHQEQHFSECGTLTSVSYQRCGYTRYVSRVLSTDVIDGNVLHQMRWAAVGGVLLALNDENLTGIQRSWSRLLLRNAFILAQEASTQQERSRLTQATVRIFLIADFFDYESSRSKTRERLPWSSAIVRDLPQFITAQIQLAQQMAEKTVDMHGASQPQYDSNLLSQFKVAAGLGSSDDNHSIAWQLLEPFMQHPELAIHWLHTSFFRVPCDLLAWIIARVDTGDAHSIQCLAAWVTFLYRNGATSGDFHAAAMRLVGKRCTQQQLQDIYNFQPATTRTNDKQCSRSN